MAGDSWDPVLSTGFGDLRGGFLEVTGSTEMCPSVTDTKHPQEQPGPRIWVHTDEPNDGKGEGGMGTQKDGEGGSVDGASN